MQHRLHELSPMPLNLIWHENKSVYLSVSKDQKCIYMRLHRLFYDAPTPVLQALVRYATKKDRASIAIIKQMAHLHFSQNKAEPKAINALGKVYDLQGIFEKLNTSLQLQNVTIGWSERKRVGKFRSITFGTFDKYFQQIRINPILDDEKVPLYFLEFIVYHEMLHAICPSQMDTSGRLFVHTSQFRKKEKQFPHYEKAKQWEKQCLTFFKKRIFHGRS